MSKLLTNTSKNLIRLFSASIIVMSKSSNTILSGIEGNPAPLPTSNKL